MKILHLELYSESQVAKIYYGGNEFIDMIEDLHQKGH